MVTNILSGKKLHRHIRVKRALHHNIQLTHPSLISIPASLWKDDDLWSVFRWSRLLKNHHTFTSRWAEGRTGKGRMTDGLRGQRTEEGGVTKNFYFWIEEHLICSGVMPLENSKGLIPNAIHPLSVTALSLLCGHRFFCCSQSQLSLGEGRVLPGEVASSSQGPHWWQRPPCKEPTAHQEQFGVQYLAQGHFDMQLSSARSWDLNRRPSDH